MRGLLLLVGIASTSALAEPAAAQVRVEIAPPTITFEAPPPLVVVEPGVQQVAEREVYVVDGWYWVRHGKRWFRARDHRGGWFAVEDVEVPGKLKEHHEQYKPFKVKKNETVVIAPDGEVVKMKVKKEKKPKK